MTVFKESDFCLRSHQLGVVQLVYTVICSLEFSRPIVLCVYAPFGSTISPKYFKYIFPLVCLCSVYIVWLENVVIMNAPFSKEICSLTCPAH